jgi:hypothetical protein
MQVRPGAVIALVLLGVLGLVGIGVRVDADARSSACRAAGRGFCFEDLDEAVVGTAMAAVGLFGAAVAGAIAIGQAARAFSLERRAMRSPGPGGSPSARPVVERVLMSRHHP